MNRSSYPVVSGIVFGFIAAVHLIRIILQAPAQVGSKAMPFSLSWVVTLAAGALCVWAFSSARRSMADGGGERKLPESNMQMQGRSELGRYLIDLVMNQDGVIQKWVGFLITIEAGLAVAAGFFLRPVERSGALPFQAGGILSRTIVSLIAAIGALSAIAISCIAVRQQKWQLWFVARFNALPGFNDWVFPREAGNLKPVKNQPVGLVGKTISGLATLMVIAWFLFALVVWCALA